MVCVSAYDGACQRLGRPRAAPRRHSIHPKGKTRANRGTGACVILVDKWLRVLLIYLTYSNICRYCLTRASAAISAVLILEINWY